MYHDDGHIFHGEFEDGQGGVFGFNTDHLDPNMGLPTITEIITTLKNVNRQIESRVLHEMILDHDGQEELDEYFKPIENLDVELEETKNEFWTPAKLRTLFALRDASVYICDRFLAAAGASRDSEDLDHGLQD